MNKDSACGDKKKFGSRDAAEKRARQLGNPFVEAYKCRFCNRWHIGHIPLSKSRDYPGWNYKTDAR